MRLVLVEDDEQIAEFVRKGLVQDGHVVEWARTGKDAVELLARGAYDAAIVDIMLPGKSGLDVIRELRKKQVQTPIIVLSARASVEDRVTGLEVGADDYLTKPFAFAELLARLHALVRRATATPTAYELSYAGVTLDLRTRRVSRDARPIQLHAKEFALLEYFMRNPERVLSKTMILEHIWEYRFDPQTNVVDVLVSRLRSKLDRDHPIKLIHTLRGAGYVLRHEA
jgi:two-component system, OmpR family, response regulator